LYLVRLQYKWPELIKDMTLPIPILQPPYSPF